MKKLLLFLFLLMSDPAFGTTYVMAPNGSNSNSGLSEALAWKTFEFSLSSLMPGDVLLLASGEYSEANGNGQFNVNCSAGYNDGTAAQPIFVLAASERQAWIRGDGSPDTIQIHNCSYWSLGGIRASGADNPNLNGSQGFVVVIESSDHINVRRMLLHNNNRYENGHILSLQNSHDSLIEENEAYYWHRHAFTVQLGGARNVFRRNYANSRGHADCSPIPPCRISNYSDRGDNAFSAYYGTQTIFENNISEGNALAGFVAPANPSNANKFYGNISLDDYYGFNVTAHDNHPNDSNTNTEHVNNIVINPGPNTDAVGFFYANGTGSIDRNNSVFGSSRFGWQFVTPQPTSPTPSATITNALVFPSIGSGDSFTLTGSPYTITCNFCAAAAAGFDSGSATVTNSFTMTVTGQSPCYAWIQAGSNVKGAGLGGADIGANILYKYQGGVLQDGTGGTSVAKLWDPSTGDFPHGALITGINDIAGDSLFDVDNRLNINANGCSFPAGYGSSGGGGSGVSYISSNTLDFGTRTNSDVPAPPAIQADDILFTLFYSYFTTVTPPAGWTAITSSPEDFGVDPSKVYVFTKRATASEPSSYTFTHSSAITEACSIALRGAELTTSIEDATPTENEATNATVTANGLTVATAGARLIYWNAVYDGPNPAEPPATFSEVCDLRQIYLAVAGSVSAAGATGSISSVNSASWEYLAGLYAVKPEVSTDPQNNTITFSDPWDGREFRIGDDLSITFNTTGTGNVTVKYSPDNGTTFRTVATVTHTSGNGSYVLDTALNPGNGRPLPASTQTKLQACQGAICTVSGAFTIFGNGF